MKARTFLLNEKLYIASECTGVFSVPDRIAQKIQKILSLKHRKVT